MLEAWRAQTKMNSGEGKEFRRERVQTKMISGEGKNNFQIGE